jgi:hypothetical protein
MAELELELRALAAEIAYPPTPDLARAVRRRLDEERVGPAWWPTRRTLAVALALVVLALAVAFAVPPARSAILRVLHLGGVTIERVDTLPAAREAPITTGLGPPLTRAQAERRAGFRFHLPKGVEPRHFYAQPSFASVALERDGKALLLSELLGDQYQFAKKLAGTGTLVQPILVEGNPGFWIEGAPHVVMYMGPDGIVRERTIRIAGNVLIWLRGGLTYRLEGPLTKKQALEIAREIR